MDDSPFARRMDGLGQACSDRRLRTRQSIPCKLNTIPSMNPLNQPACRITQEGFTHRQAVSGYRWMDSGTVHDGLVGSGVQVGSIMRACKRLGIIHRCANNFIDYFILLITFKGLKGDPMLVEEDLLGLANTSIHLKPRQADCPKFISYGFNFISFFLLHLMGI